MVVAILMTSSRAKCCGGVIVCRGVEEIGDKTGETEFEVGQLDTHKDGGKCVTFHEKRTSYVSRITSKSRK